MFSRTLTFAERQLLRHQWQQSGKCIRCFHASLRKSAGEDGSGKQSESSTNGNDHGTPYNKPQRGPSRHQRAAQISEEVRMLNRETPPGPSKPPSDSIAFNAVHPTSTGPRASQGTMGKNIPPEREGPYGQGAARPVRPQDDIEADSSLSGTQQIRSTRSPALGVEEPAEGGAGLLEGNENSAALDQSLAGPEEDDKVIISEAAGEEEDDGVPQQPGLFTRTQQRATTPLRGPRLPTPGTPYQAPSPSREAFVTSGTNSSTIAAANFEGVLADRIRTIAEPGQDPKALRDLHLLAQQLRSRGPGKKIVRFITPDEREAVLKIIYNQLREEEAANAAKQAQIADPEHPEQPLREFGPPKDGRSVQKYTDVQGNKKYYWDGSSFFRPLNKQVRKSLVERTVNGRYDADGLLAGQQKHKQPVLNEIVRQTLLNGAYTEKDGERLLKKVRSLLPASVQQQQAKIAAGAGARTAAAKPGAIKGASGQYARPSPRTPGHQKMVQQPAGR